MIPSKIDRMRRRAQRRMADDWTAADEAALYEEFRPEVEAIKLWASQRGAEAKPTAEVGDRYGWWAADEGDKVKVGGQWFLVRGKHPHSRALLTDRRNRLTEDPNAAWVTPDEIEDVYTKSDQEVNGALVTVPWQEIDDLIYDLLPDEIGWSNGVDHFSDGDDEHYVLTPEAVAALGAFRPVPERAIHVGDSVRFVSNYSGQEVVDRVSHINPTGSFGGFDADGRGWSRSEEDLSLVAPEDPAFIAPPVIKEPEPAPSLDGPVFLGDHWCNPCTKKSDSASKCTCYPGGFTPDSFEGPKRGCPEHDPTTSIPEAWDLITAGDRLRELLAMVDRWRAEDGQQ